MQQQHHLPQQTEASAADIIVRNELEKYIADLELAIRDLDSEISTVERENEDLEGRNMQYNEKVRELMLKLMMAQKQAKPVGSKKAKKGV